MSDESLRVCVNCQREISTSNYQMHTVHCQRNIVLCPKCQEPVPRTELNGHDLEFHSQIKCTDCHTKLESSSLDNHKENECLKRQQLCQYCDLELKADAMFEHLEYCGSRTESCEVCGKLIMFKYQKMHEESGHRKIRPDEEVEDSSDDDGAYGSRRENSRNHYSDNYVRQQSDRPRITANAHYSQRLAYDLEDQYLDEYLGNLELDRARTATVRSCINYGAGIHSQRLVNNVNPEMLIPCEFCERPIVADELVQHQTGCRPDLTSSPKSREDRERNSSEEYDTRTHSHNTSPRAPEESILIPCEFCEKPFSLDFFDIHQSACQQNTATRLSNRHYDDDNYD